MCGHDKIIPNVSVADDYSLVFLNEALGHKSVPFFGKVIFYEHKIYEHKKSKIAQCGSLIVWTFSMVRNKWDTISHNSLQNKDILNLSPLKGVGKLHMA